MKNLFLNGRLFWVLGGLVVLFVAGQFVAGLADVAKGLLVGLGVTVGLDALLLFRIRDGLEGSREVSKRLSNGDENDILIELESRYPHAIHVELVDELPFQFQMRDHTFDVKLEAGAPRTIRYTVRPTERGVYAFGALNTYVRTRIGLLQRRYRFAMDREVAVYPSYLQMQAYALLAASNRLTEVGVKRVRRVGHTMEFDQIREYVPGDDYRTINWKATARRPSLMVNQYQDERAQHVYCVIDTGRVMKMPFAGMTLLDHAINASLVLSNIALQKEDRAGLVTFAERVQTIVPAARRSDQMQRLMETLYRIETGFEETDFARLYARLRRDLAQRSLLLVFTNFESKSGLRRQLSYLRMLARRHVVVVIFFENTELDARLRQVPRTLEDVYIKTIAEQFAFEKREIVKTLKQYGIYAVLTPPENLTVNTINQYLELKARGRI